MTTLSDDEAPAPRLSPRAEALDRVADAWVQAGDFDRALELAETIPLSAPEKDVLLAHLADRLLGPFAPGGEEAREYVAKHGGTPALLKKIPTFGRIIADLNGDSARVKLMVRLKNVYDLLGEEEVARLRATAGPSGSAGAVPAPGASRSPSPLPAPRQLLEEATRIVTRMPDRAADAPPALGSPQVSLHVLLAGLGGLFGAVSIAVVQGMSNAFGSQVGQALLTPYRPQIAAAVSEALTPAEPGPSGPGAAPPPEAPALGGPA